MKVMIFAVVVLLMLSITSSAFSISGEFSQVKDTDSTNKVEVFSEPDSDTTLKKEKLIVWERTDNKDNTPDEEYLRVGTDIFCPPLSLSSLSSSVYCVRAD